ncbi:hypothetical protein D068_cds28110 [Bacillus atrophaeus UCMB-5137]|nr:hypothetical protein D068_cds28110 [Bacillus atrophaeus UCMB-5137]
MKRKEVLGFKPEKKLPDIWSAAFFINDKPFLSCVYERVLLHLKKISA